MWDVATGENKHTLEGHTSVVRTVAFSPDGKYLVSGSMNAAIRLWNAENGEHVRTLKSHAGSVNIVAFSPDGETLVSGSADGTVLLWDFPAIVDTQ